MGSVSFSLRNTFLSHCLRLGSLCLDSRWAGLCLRLSASRVLSQNSLVPNVTSAWQEINNKVIVAQSLPFLPLSVSHESGCGNL